MWCEINKGNIYLNDERLTEENVDRLRLDLGIIFQNPDNQFVGSTVKDDIAFGLENRNIDRIEMEKLINKYSKDDVYLGTYGSIVEASNDVNTPASNISAVLAKRKNCKTAGGYKWYYADDPEQPDKTKIIK